MWTSGASAPTGLPSDTSSRCAALGNAGSTSDNQQLCIWNCSAATLDQGWYKVLIGPDAAGHSCYYIMNEKAWNNGWGIRKVIAVKNGNMSNGAQIVLKTYDSSALDQLWCEY
jgi:hypothetical protein